MPRYDYRCDSCGERFEVVQSFSDPSLTECPHCGAEGLKKVFGNVGVVFKGSGFYRNDSREAAKKKPAAKAKSDTGSSESGGTADSGTGKSEKADKKKESAGSAKPGSDGKAAAKPAGASSA